jgi:iron complex outermembrane receptor protein
MGSSMYIRNALTVTLILASLSATRLYGAEEPDSSALQEIVVSATRQGDQSVQSIPMSISVINPQTLDKLGATNLGDLAPSVPSLSIEQSGPGLNKIDMRGISTGAADIVNNLEDRPLVAVYIDDTPLSLQGLNPDLKVFDLDRVEVLRGPQGTLYGASAMGGTIRYITKKPDPNDLFGSAEIVVSDTAGGGVNYGVRGTINLPIEDDRVGLLLAGYNGRNSGWIDNVENGKSDINWDRSTQGRAALRFKATDQLTLDASILFEKLDTGGSNFAFSGLGQNKYASLTATPINDDMKVYNLTGEYAADWGRVISSTSYMTRTVGYNDTGQYLTEAYFIPSPPMAAPFINQNDVTQFSQEVRVISNQTGAIKWIAGAYYDHLIRKDFQNDNSPGFDAAFGALTGDPTFSSLDYGGFDPNSIFSARENIWEHEIGLFSEVTWTPVPRLDLTAGLRYFDWHQNFYLYFGGIAGSLGPDEPLVTQQSADASGANPRFVANFRATDNTILFLEAARGFRYGGVNQPVPITFCGEALAADGLKAAPLTYGPDHLWSYSLGEKTTLDDSRVRLNATAFLINWDEVQTEKNLSCSYSFVENAGTIKSTGAELESAYKVTSALTLGLNASYTHAVANGPVPNVNALSGDRVPYFPQYLGSVTADYAVPVGEATLRFNGEYQYHGNSATEFSSSDPLYRVLPAYSNVNVAANWEFAKWQFGLFVRNLANSSQVTMILPDALGTQPGDEVAYGRPRTIGMRVAHEF